MAVDLLKLNSFLFAHFDSLLNFDIFEMRGAKFEHFRHNTIKMQQFLFSILFNQQIIKHSCFRSTIVTRVTYGDDSVVDVEQVYRLLQPVFYKRPQHSEVMQK